MGWHYENRVQTHSPKHGTWHARNWNNWEPRRVAPLGKNPRLGVCKIGDAVECGVFEIDAGSETFRPLFIGRFPDCGGDISPDGKYVLNSSRAEGNLLTVRDLDTGAVRPVGRNMTGATWSPDGRWIAAIRHVSGSSDVILIDAANISRRKNLGEPAIPRRCGLQTRKTCCFQSCRRYAAVGFSRVWRSLTHRQASAAESKAPIARLT